MAVSQIAVERLIANLPLLLLCLIQRWSHISHSNSPMGAYRPAEATSVLQNVCFWILEDYSKHQVPTVWSGQPDSLQESLKEAIMLKSTSFTQQQRRMVRSLSPWTPSSTDISFWSPSCLPGSLFSVSLKFLLTSQITKYWNTPYLMLGTWCLILQILSPRPPSPTGSVPSRLTFVDYVTM